MTDAERLKQALDRYRIAIDTPYETAAYARLREVVASIQAKAERRAP